MLAGCNSFNEGNAAGVMCVVLTPQASRDFLDVAESYSRRWQRAFQYEKEQRHHLEQTIEQLAKQHNSLERAWRENPSSYTGETHSENMALFWPVAVLHIYHRNVSRSYTINIEYIYLE